MSKLLLHTIVLRSADNRRCSNSHSWGRCGDVVVVYDGGSDGCSGVVDVLVGCGGGTER